MERSKRRFHSDVARAVLDRGPGYLAEQPQVAADSAGRDERRFAVVALLEPCADDDRRVAVLERTEQPNQEPECDGPRGGENQPDSGPAGSVNCASSVVSVWSRQA
jgi:hypothetical protein